MSEKLAQLEKKGNSQIPFSVVFTTTVNGGQCYGYVRIDATKVSKISFNLVAQNAYAPDDTATKYVRAINQNNQIVARFTGTGVKELIMNPSWGQVNLVIYCTVTAPYGSISLNDIKME